MGSSDTALLPLWDPRWISADPVRRDLTVGLLLGGGVAAAFCTLSRDQSFTVLLLLFAACFVLQIVRGLVAISSHRHAGLIWTAIIFCGPVLLAATIVFPTLGALLAVGLFALRVTALKLRGDLDMLLLGAAVWVLSVALVGLQPYPYVAIPLAVGAGLLVSSWTLARGYRACRLLRGVSEAPSMIFGLVLGVISVTKAVGVLSPGPSHSAALAAPAGSGTGQAVTQVQPTRVHYIGGYRRTVADGNPFNNLSTPPAQRTGLGAIQQVRGHARSVADGVTSNNLANSHPSPSSLTGVRAIPVTLVSGGPVGYLADFPFGLALTFSMASSPTVLQEIRTRRESRSGWWWRLIDSL